MCLMTSPMKIRARRGRQVNLLKPRRFFTYHQVLTFKNSTRLSLCVKCFVRISEQTAIFALYIINWLVSIIVVESVYCAVRTGSLNKAVCASSLTRLLTGSWTCNKCIHSCDCPDIRTFNKVELGYEVMAKLNFILDIFSCCTEFQSTQPFLPFDSSCSEMAHGGS